MTRRAHYAAVLLLVAVAAVAGCSTADAPPAAQQPAPSTAEPSASASPSSEGEIMTTNDTEITIIINDQRISARLHDNPAANALVEQLPLTLTFDHYNAVEVIATLPTPLSMEGMPEGDDPEIGDIGFWAPGGDLVLYYGDVGYWRGIARLGTFDNAAAIAGLTGPVTITISERE